MPYEQMQLLKRTSFCNAFDHGFTVGTYEDLIPTADLVCNLTPDKQHTAVITAIMPLMKKSSTLAYSHGFNIVEEGKLERYYCNYVCAKMPWIRSS
jgi:ketol-acid reductoisomerase